MRSLRRKIASLVLIVSLSVLPEATADPSETWVWPTAGQRVVTEPYRAPTHAYGPGHRGMDVAAATGSAIVSPTAGTVAFRGVVVDRPLVTIETAEGVVLTFEPISSELSPGDQVTAGQVLGVVARGGHTSPNALHLGVRVKGAYVNPLPFFGGIPRARLLPCC